MKDNGLLDDYELTSLNRIVDAYLDDANWDEFVSMLNELTESYENRYESIYYKGHVLGLTLSIGNASKLWWESNPNAPYVDQETGTRVLPAWLLADAIGAVAGAAFSYAYQEATGDCTADDPCDVGGGMLAGAVFGSTGVIGKASKWLKGLI